MKKRQLNEQIKRASLVIKADRMGISSGIEEVISKEIEDVLNDFFALSDNVKTEIDINNRGFSIKITVNAYSVKQIKIL